LVVGEDFRGGRPKRKRKGRPKDDELAFQNKIIIGRIGDIDSRQFLIGECASSLYLGLIIPFPLV